MTEQWFTDEQVKQVGKDLYDFNADALEEVMEIATKKWGELSQEQQQKWFDKASAQLATVVPLDLSRPLRLRDGTPVTDAKLSDDGLQIIATIPAWGSAASWPRNGCYDGDPNPTDLLYADNVPEADDGLVERAREFARAKHAGQMCKYTGEPYFSHLDEVAGIVEKAGLSEEAVTAAWLHDVVEDTETRLSEIVERFGGNVAEMVYMLTDEPPRDGLNRGDRKTIDRARLSGALPEVQGIKCADLISNTSTIVKHDRNFARRYLPEKRAILEILTKAPLPLMTAAWSSLRAAEEELEACAE